MDERVHLTPEGLEKLKEELQHLKSVERHDVIKAIEEALEHGDLSENAEYHAAKEKQGFIEGRIQDIEDKLTRVDIIDITKLPTDKVVFGLKVTLYDVDEEKEFTYQLVGQEEADAKAMRISVTSPIGRAIIGKEEGDSVTVNLPNGTRELEIVGISH